MQRPYPRPVDNFIEIVNSHGWRSLAPFAFDGETLRRIERLEDGRVVCISMTADGYDVEPDADVPATVERMLNLGLDLRSFHAFAGRRKALRRAAERGQGRLLRSPTLFEDVVKTILTTNTTWAMTQSMVGRLVDKLGDPWPADPQRRAFPTPEALAEADLSTFKLGYRAGYLHAFADSVAGGQLDLASLETLPGPERRKALLSIPGVGPYAAAHLAVLLNDFSTVPVDSWARTLLSRKLNRAVTDREVHAFFEPYGQWRYLAYRFFDWGQELEWW